MEQLKEAMIIETFKGLSADRQRYVLEQLIIETKQTSVTITFETPEQERLYEFARKQWPLMSIDFFKQLCVRWEFLCMNSYGNNETSTCDVGDLYLQSEPFTVTKGYGYSEQPFAKIMDEATLFQRKYFFYTEIFNHCKWEYMFITMLFPGDEWSKNYSIALLMELPEAEYICKMKEYKYKCE